MTVLLSACLFIAAFVFILAALSALKLAFKKHDQTTAYKLLFFCTILSAVAYFYPFYCSYFSAHATFSFVKSFFLSIHHAIRLFVVDVNYDELRAFSADFGLLGDLYAGFGILLFLIAPILTFTFIVSFLQDISIVFLIWFSPKADYYIFSELNLQSLYLAQDIRENIPRANIIFLGVNRENKTYYEKIKAYTRHIRPVLLPNDYVQFNQLMARYKRNANFFMISENQEENSAAVISILDSTPHASHRNIYVRLRQQDRLLDNLPVYRNTQIFRIEHIYSLVTHNLQQIGPRLFEHARDIGNGTKEISVLVVGLGATGAELVKSLAWFTQIEGYTTNIHVFEQNANTIAKFVNSCPGLFGKDTADPHCQITIHNNMIFGHPDFDKTLASLGDIGFVFVVLGSDNLNANAALDIRKNFARQGKHPPIQAVLRNDDAGKLIAGSKNYRGVSYDIEFFGSYKEIYRLDFITDAKNRQAVFKEALTWHNEEHAREFASHEEQYRISKSLIMHRELMQQLGIPKEDMSRSAHRCWVNLLFAEGYIYGPQRDDIAKRNPYLVNYDELPEQHRNVR